MKGIVIFATNWPLYGRYAYNLAVTIKAAENIPICLLYSGRAINHLSALQREMFDQIILLPDDVPASSGVKLWVNEFTPFKETLLLDADMLWLTKKPSALFNELKDVNFTAITEGYYESEQVKDVNPQYFFWADPTEIQSVYKTGRVYQWRSEVMYFKKSKESDKFFRLAQKVFKEPKLKTVKLYANGIPDELAVNVSAAVSKLEPHVYKWQPAYWYKLNRGIVPGTELFNTHYLLSLGSNQNSSAVKKLYDRLVRAACYKMGCQHVFPLSSKKEAIPERLKM